MARTVRIGPLLIASFAVKLLVLAWMYSIDPERIVAGDSASYENPAVALMATGRFSSNVDAPSRIETLRTPGYPAFIAAIFFVLPGSRLAVATGQIAISTATLGLVYVFAAQLWNASTAMAAAAFFACDLLSFVYAPLLQSETLFAFAFVITAWAGVTLLGTSSTRGVPSAAPALGCLRWALLFGSAASWATLIRPIAYYLFLPSLGAIVLHGLLHQRSIRRLTAVALVAALPWILLVEGWRLRNYFAAGRGEIAQIAAVDLLWYRGAGIVAQRDHISFWDARDRIARSLPDTTGWSPGAVSSLYQREGLRLIAAYPILFLRMQLYGLLKILAGPGRADLRHYLAGVPYEDEPAGAIGLSTRQLRQRFEPDRPLVLIALIYATAYLVALYVCVSFGVCKVVRAERRALAPHVFVWCSIIYLVVLAAGPEAYARFRVPIMPLLALYAGRGAKDAFAFVRRRSLRAAPAVTAG
jgi:4-amino-4-deoxy-L-arabinose transferase-like glycosyltransferase